MSDPKDLSDADLAKAIDRLAAVTERALQPVNQQKSQAMTSFEAHQLMRKEAEESKRPEQYVAFRSPTGGIGVAVVQENRICPDSGMVVRFDPYEHPTDEQVALDGAPDESKTSRDTFVMWRYKRYVMADTNAFSKQESSRLPGTCPRRATHEEALVDLEGLRAERDLEYSVRLENQEQAPKVTPQGKPLPPTVPLKKAK